MGKKISEKILAKNAGKKEASSGEFTQATHTSCFVCTGGARPIQFKELGQWPPKVYDPTKIAMVPADHAGTAGWRYGRRYYVREHKEFARAVSLYLQN